ncbi:phosphatidylserine decarboxylase [Methanolobus psychrotolerans]|uniref:phosphatidylserine decarboxylase n=1 Tax=Methanolobus psychrotolerans TaxID=1874706 RepID=UPI000B91B766|nr:phosphatidylserine decarboxylase [Methanolobus psychrotolerans]
MLAKGSFPWIFTSITVGVTSLLAYLIYNIPYTGKLALLAICITVFFLFFFRDPEREIKEHEDYMLSPADGKIVDIRDRKICIFMNFQNVHVNRAPITGKVRTIEHKKGGYIPAFCKDSCRNERSHTLIETKHGIVEVIQIAGTVTRRIVSYVREGEHMAQGQRFGMIRFGSRVDVTIPENFKIIAQKGDRVLAGETVIARIR